MLYVDGNPENAYLMRRALKQYSIPADLDALDDGEKAIDYLHGQINRESTFPDLLLIDYNSPVLNAEEILIRMNGFGWETKCPVVVLTGSSSAKLHDKALRLGAAACLVKPFEFSGYKAIVNTVMELYLEANN